MERGFCDVGVCVIFESQINVGGYLKSLIIRAKPKSSKSIDDSYTNKLNERNRLLSYFDSNRNSGGREENLSV